MVHLLEAVHLVPQHARCSSSSGDGRAAEAEVDGSLDTTSWQVILGLLMVEYLSSRLQKPIPYPTVLFCGGPLFENVHPIATTICSGCQSPNNGTSIPGIIDK